MKVVCEYDNVLVLEGTQAAELWEKAQSKDPKERKVMLALFKLHMDNLARVKKTLEQGG